ncbi:MAG: Gfo/Idh/MocA family oxidoreductase [Candidatus Glassbacteria bacterium]|nr:Gfo/Idh/MocA family oxidoreductase [Candidatus Glassbacteria bacterium]
MQNKSGSQKLNRRDFFRQGSSVAVGAASLAALGAPAILSGQNLNSRITLGMIGTGSRGGSILRSIDKHERSIVTDLCDIYQPNLQESAGYVTRNPKVRTTEIWEELVERKDLDAVIVSTPLYLHVPMCIAALETGKHVFSEKSMGLNMKQVNQMAAAAAEHADKVYLVGYQSHLNECLAEAKRIYEAGSIGKATQFSVHFDRNQTWKKEDVPAEWERVLNWRLYKEYCGGVLTEVVTHEIDQVLHILGTMPVKAGFYGEIMVYKDGREHHDSVMGAWEMEDGVLGFGTGHFSNTYRGVGWILQGTHGTIVSDGGSIKIYWEKAARHLDSFGIEHKFTAVKLGQSLEDVSSSSMTKPKEFKKEVDGDYELSTGREFEHFYDCILDGVEPLMGAGTARKPSVAAFMAYESSMNGGRQYTREEIEAMG